MGVKFLNGGVRGESRLSPPDHPLGGRPFRVGKRIRLDLVRQFYMKVLVESVIH